MEEVTTELSVYLAMLYHMVEVFKGQDDFADELSKLNSLMQHPSLPQVNRLRLSESRTALARLLIQRGCRSPRQKRQGLSSQESLCCS